MVFFVHCHVSFREGGIDSRYIMYIQQVSQVCWIYHFLDLDLGSRYHAINPTFWYLPFISCQHENSVSPKVWQLRSTNDVDMAIFLQYLVAYECNTDILVKDGLNLQELWTVVFCGEMVNIIQPKILLYLFNTENNPVKYHLILFIYIAITLQVLFFWKSSLCIFINVDLSSGPVGPLSIESSPQFWGFKPLFEFLIGWDGVCGWGTWMSPGSERINGDRINGLFHRSL